MENLYGAKVENGKIIVNDNNADENITIKTCEGINLFINGVMVPYGLKYRITSSDEIKYEPQVIEPTRKMQLEISEDKMEARLTVIYKKGYTFRLVDKPWLKNLALRAEKIKSEEYKQYRVDEVKELLSKEKIKFGINISKIFQAILGTGEEGIIVAQGIKCVNDKPKRLELCINTEERKIKDDNKTTLNYRNRVILPNVEEGQVIAKVVQRIEGNNGEDIYGKVLKKKSIKDPKLLVGEGCEIRDDVVIAQYSGRPVFKSNILTISKTLTLNTVNIKTGDVNFSGNVIVNGKVESGSNIKCGGFLQINGTIDNSKIVSNGDSTYKSAILNSVILTGAYDVEKTTYLNILKEFLKNIKSLLDVAENLYDKATGKSIGEIIEFLIEQRYKEINKLGVQILAHNIKLGITDSSVLDFIRTKLLNMGAVNIKSINQFILFKEEIENIIDDLSTDAVIKLDCTLSYIQKCAVKATGNVFIKGMGSYQSQIYALESVIYEDKDAICRGGTIQAVNGDIKLGTVGSMGGIKTEINCNNTKGVIEVEVAYAGTLFIIGRMKYLVKDNIRHVKVYLDEDGQIKCDCLKY